MSVPTAVGVTVWLPVFAKVPVQAPEAVQPVAFADDQVIVVELPVTIEQEPRVRVGADGTPASTICAALSA